MCYKPAMRSIHCTRALLAVTFATVTATIATPPPAGAQQPAGPATSTLTVFLRSAAVGSEQSSVVRSADGWTITSSGRINLPFDVVTRRFQARYDENWKPLELTVDSTIRGQLFTLHTTID